MHLDWGAAATLIAALVALGGVAITPAALFHHRRKVETEAFQAQVDDHLRHAVQNWRVVDQMIRDAPSRPGVPLLMHFKKPRAAGPIFSAESLAYLPATTRALALRLHHRLENFDVEIDEAILALNAGRLNLLDTVLLHLRGTIERLHVYLATVKSGEPHIEAPLSLILSQDATQPKAILYRRVSE